MKPPVGKNYSYYALCNAQKAGIYCRYSTLLNAIQNEQSPNFRGFYSFNEALNYLWDNVDEKATELFIEGEEPRHGHLIEVLDSELRQKDEEIHYSKEVINEFEEREQDYVTSEIEALKELNKDYEEKIKYYQSISNPTCQQIHEANEEDLRHMIKKMAIRESNGGK